MNNWQLRKELLHLNKKEYGSFGESRAVEYLDNKNYEVLEQNFRCRIGEIDIIAKDKENLVFIEVKTRSSIYYGLPGESVNFRKQQTIGRCAKIYLVSKKKYKDINCRFDVIEVMTECGKIGNINHYINAYQPRMF